MLTKFLIWAGMSFWGWPQVLYLFAEPEDGWGRLLVYILWLFTFLFVPFIVTTSNLEKIMKDYLK